MSQTLDLGKVMGSKMHNVNAVPASTLGLDGDWALNPANGEVYEKVSGAWARRGSFKGPTGNTGATGATGTAGAAGARGSTWTQGTAITGTATAGTIFSGSGITAARVGDMYLNTSTWAVYTCTTAGAAAVAKWAYLGIIKGATGATGAQGAQGIQGVQGAKGDKGDTGARGATGAQGATGATGAAGAAGADGKTPTFAINSSGHLIATFN